MFALFKRSGSHCKVHEMKRGTHTIRLAALFVLLTSFVDFWAYDRWDPAAPMNSSDSEDVLALDLLSHLGVGLCSATLPDDDCLYCSPMMAPTAPIVQRPATAKVSVHELTNVVISAALTPAAMSPSPPSPDGIGFSRPLRV